MKASFQSPSCPSNKPSEEHGIASDDIFVCAEFTGRFIYPLVCACDELELFLWMENPTKNRNSSGIAKDKDDKMDVRCIAEYINRFFDKVVAYGMPDRTLASIKSKLAVRDILLDDRERYETQLHDQKGFVDSKNYAQKSRVWNAVIKTLNKQLAEIVSSNKRISRQADLLKSMDGVGHRMTLYMVAFTMNFKRFQNPRQLFCYARLALFWYTSGKTHTPRCRRGPTSISKHYSIWPQSLLRHT